MKALINLILTSQQANAAVISKIIKQIQAHVDADVLIHSPSKFEIECKGTPHFIEYPEGVKFKKALRKTVVFINNGEIDNQTIYEVVINLSNKSNFDFFDFSNLDSSKIKQLIDCILANPMHILLPPMYGLVNDTLKYLDKLMFVAHTGVFRILVSYIKELSESEKEIGTLLGFICYRFGIAIVPVPR